MSGTLSFQSGKPFHVVRQFPIVANDKVRYIYTVNGVEKINAYYDTSAIDPNNTAELVMDIHFREGVKSAITPTAPGKVWDKDLTYENTTVSQKTIRPSMIQFYPAVKDERHRIQLDINGEHMYSDTWDIGTLKDHGEAEIFVHVHETEPEKE